MAGRRPATIVENGRAKAYRPLPEADRRAGLAAYLDAYARGDFFLAHELLEPAWMGAADLPERALLSGLIKLAAAFVHDARGNPAGVVKNLAGAAVRLGNGVAAGPGHGVDVPAVLTQVAAALEAVGRGERPSAVEITPLAGGTR